MFQAFTKAQFSQDVKLRQLSDVVFFDVNHLMSTDFEANLGSDPDFDPRMDTNCDQTSSNRGSSDSDLSDSNDPSCYLSSNDSNEPMSSTSERHVDVVRAKAEWEFADWHMHFGTSRIKLEFG